MKFWYLLPTLHLLWLLCSRTFSSFPTFRQPCNKDCNLWVASSRKFSKDDYVKSDDNGDVGKNDDNEDDAEKNDDDSDNRNDNANGPDRCGEKDDCEGKTGDAQGTKTGHVPGGIICILAASRSTQCKLSQQQHRWTEKIRDQVGERATYFLYSSSLPSATNPGGGFLELLPCLWTCHCCLWRLSLSPSCSILQHSWWFLVEPPPCLSTCHCCLWLMSSSPACWSEHWQHSWWLFKDSIFILALWRWTTSLVCMGFLSSAGFFQV